MKPEQILRTIENHLGLEHGLIPEIEEDPEYLRKRVIKAETQINRRGKEISIKVIVSDKHDIASLAEELTHVIDLNNSAPTRITEYEDYFYDNVLIEALGYYGLKIISPTIKHELILPQLKKAFKEKDWTKLRNAYTQEGKLDDGRWHEIGYDLGEKIYDYVQKTGNKEIATKLMIKNREREKPFEVYQKILEEVTK